jgi:hypothetical protein
MKFFKTMLILFFALFLFAACGGDDDSGNTGNTGNTGDTGDTGDSGSGDNSFTFEDAGETYEHSTGTYSAPACTDLGAGILALGITNYDAGSTTTRMLMVNISTSETSGSLTVVPTAASAEDLSGKAMIYVLVTVGEESSTNYAAQSGTAELTIEGKVYSMEFSNLPVKTQDGDTETLSGSFSCTLP